MQAYNVKLKPPQVINTFTVIHQVAPWRARRRQLRICMDPEYQVAIGVQLTDERQQLGQQKCNTTPEPRTILVLEHSIGLIV